MSRYLIDTTPLSALVVNRPAAVTLVTPWMMNHEAVTSILVYGEVFEYLRSRGDFEQRTEHLRTLLNEIRPLDLSRPIMERYADLRRALRPPHGPGLIGDIDTLIAATAIEHDLTVVTTDSDFQRVPGLQSMIVTVR